MTFEVNKNHQMISSLYGVYFIDDDMKMLVSYADDVISLKNVCECDNFMIGSSHYGNYSVHENMHNGV